MNSTGKLSDMSVDRSFDLPSLLRQRLESGENVVWESAPDLTRSAALQAGWSAVGMVGIINIVSWLHLAVEGYSRRDSSQQSATAAFILVGLPVALLAIVALCAPITAFVRARRTLYAITNRRVIVMRGPGEGGFEAYAPSDLSNIRVAGEFWDVGNIVFAHPGITLASGAVLRRPAVFSSVRNCGDVARMLRTLASPDARVVS